MVLGSCLTRPLASFARLENHLPMFFGSTRVFKCCVTVSTNLASNTHHFSGSGMQARLTWVPAQGLTEQCGGHRASLGGLRRLGRI